MSKTILIKLTPLDSFFFGGETTLGEGNGRNYFAHSNHFPQQTTLLGMLRHQILMQNDLLPLSDANSEKAREWIGEKSFDGSQNQTFGKILKISPVFMLNEGAKYFVRSKEFVEGTHLILQKGNINNTWSFNGCNKEFIPILKKPDGSAYNPKKDFEESLVYNSTTKKLNGDVFKPSAKVGITKNYDGSPTNEAFFKQTFWRLTPKWSFGFLAEIADNTKLESVVILMGAEKRQFKMEISDSSEKIDNKDFANNYKDAKTPQYSDLQKVILLSDAIVPEDIYEKSDFAIASTTNFRNILTDMNVKKWSAMNQADNKDGEKPSKSKKYRIVARGSVFFGSDLSNLTTALNKEQQYQKIGFNFYKLIDKNPTA